MIQRLFGSGLDALAGPEVAPSFGVHFGTLPNGYGAGSPFGGAAIGGPGNPLGLDLGPVSVNPFFGLKVTKHGGKPVLTPSFDLLLSPNAKGVHDIKKLTKKLKGEPDYDYIQPFPGGIPPPGPLLPPGRPLIPPGGPPFNPPHHVPGPIHPPHHIPGPIHPPHHHPRPGPFHPPHHEPHHPHPGLIHNTEPFHPTHPHHPSIHQSPNVLPPSIAPIHSVNSPHNHHRPTTFHPSTPLGSHHHVSDANRFHSLPSSSQPQIHQHEHHHQHTHVHKHENSHSSRPTQGFNSHFSSTFGRSDSNNQVTSKTPNIIFRETVEGHNSRTPAQGDNNNRFVFPLT